MDSVTPATEARDAVASLGSGDNRKGGSDVSRGVPAVVRVRLFGPARHLANRGTVEVVVEGDRVELARLLDELTRAYPNLAPIVAGSQVAVNGEYVSDRRRSVTPSDDVALHPPYSGG